MLRLFGLVTLIFFHGRASLLPLGSDVEFHFGNKEHVICPTVSITTGILFAFSPDNDIQVRRVEWVGCSQIIGREAESCIGDEEVTFFISVRVGH